MARLRLGLGALGTCSIVVQDATTPAPLVLPSWTVGTVVAEGPPDLPPPSDLSSGLDTASTVALFVGGASALYLGYRLWERTR